MEMLNLHKVIGFLPTRDAERARIFFETTLGLQFVSDDDYALVVQSGPTIIRIAKVQDFQPAPYTVLGWEVQDIGKIVSELQARGVAFEDYPFIQDRELGIWSAPSGAKVAWFKDPDGNLLSVSQYR
jgi:catechol 2,3-dioxygenase-like lactoylglutathione lyase family enzyme